MTQIFVNAGERDMDVSPISFRVHRQLCIAASNRD
jgi:hypothetical protein